MDERSNNILGSLMAPKRQLVHPNDDKENISQMAPMEQACNATSSSCAEQQRGNSRPPPAQRTPRPTSGASSSLGSALGNTSCIGPGGRQHKLKQRFTVIKKLGKGTYGKVQLAINKETGQEVAIKTIKKTKIENEQDLQRVRREIQIMSSIEHPHIVHIYEVFENKDKIVLVMQYAPGGELYEYVSQSKLLDDSEARRLFRQIATAIYYCHQNKICHRDLKLENILLDEKNNAKLADFGLSNVFDKRRQLKTFCGSPLYASPEIVQGSPYEGPEVDCWSLGVLLYTLVYGAMPFDGSNFKRLVKQISEACYYEPSPHSMASPLIRRLLCADPTKRATIYDICSDPWVNGTMTPSSGRISPAANGQSLHTSLLQVAQDMAELTPVRLDILLALAPSAPETVVQPPPPGTTVDSAVATRPPLATHSDNAASSSEKRSPVMDLAAMEVDETRATSPVASYIVRDLEPHEAEGQDEQMASAQDVEPSDDEMARDKVEMAQREEEVELSVAPEAQEIKVESDIMQVDTSASEKNVSVEEFKIENDQPELIEDNQVKAKAESETMNEDHSTGAGPSAADHLEPRGEDFVEREGDKEEVSEPTVEAEIEMETEARPGEAAPEEPRNKANKTPEEALQPQAETSPGGEIIAPTGKAEATPAEQSSEQPEKASGEEKPKKVKKKIIVVRKKKKVPKKDGEESKEAPEEGGQDGSDPKVQADAVKPPATEQEQNKKTTKPKGPGKLRIPNTFQAQEEKAAPAPPVPKAALETRRQSNLVAEVSQKLLQQGSGPVASSEQAPPQLPPGGRVSDKKSEFERRASLAVVVGPNEQAQPSSPKRGQPRELQDDFMEPAECSREPLSILDRILCGLVEPIAKAEPLEAVSLLSVPPGTKRSSSDEPRTPTPVDVGADDLPGAVDELRQRLSDVSTATAVPIPDDRSDSVETIKPDWLGESPPATSEAPVRSSLVVKLAPPGGANKEATGEREEKVEEKEASSQSGALPSLVGPAPITRSYKKVTFTKEGACITETGKIYSTQGRDGSVRRVERKSKITHYPANLSEDGKGGEISGSGASVRQQEQEEEFVCDLGGGRQGRVWRVGTSSVKSSSSSASQQARGVSGRPFERLIMPGSLFMGPDFDNDNLESADGLTGDFQARRPSLLSRQSAHLGRADSVSSCSSGSTDAFDDTFDTWTGAISMFNQKRGSLGLPNSSLFERAFEDPFNCSLFSTSSSRNKPSAGRREGATSSSLAGTPRCESVEPGQGRHGGRLFRRPGERGTRTGEPDGRQFGPADEPDWWPISAAGMRDRPVSASGLFRGQRAGRTAINEPPFSEEPRGESVEPRDLFRSLEQEHENLRQRIFQRHKQFWKGSTPSLLEEFRSDGPGEGEDFSTLANQAARQRAAGHREEQEEKPALWELVGHQNQGSLDRPRGEEGKNSRQQIPGVQSDQLTQSQSSSSFLPHSIALNAEPVRKNHQHEAVRTDGEQHKSQRSLSRTSFVSSQLAQVQLNDAKASNSGQPTNRQSTASFIELKRASSSVTSSSNVDRLGQEQTMSKRQEEHVIEEALAGTGNSHLLSSASRSSSIALWEGRVAPSTAGQVGPQGDSDSPLVSGTASCKFHDDSSVDSRVQNWLQESTGDNQSCSLSGSHSSATSTTGDVQNSWSRVHLDLAEPRTNRTLPPISPSRSGLQNQMGGAVQGHNKQVSHSTSSTVLLSSSRASLGSGPTSAGDEDPGAQVSSSSRASSSSKAFSTRTCATITLRSPGGQSPLAPLAAQTTEGQMKRTESFHQQSGTKQQRQLFHQHASSTSSFQAIRTSSGSIGQARTTGNKSPMTAPIGGANSSDLGVQWRQNHQSGGDLSSHETAAGEEASLSGAGSNCDLESLSSSSLLDQLRSRGYRSMINQRLVSDQPVVVQQKQQHGSLVTGSSSTASVVESSSATRVITTSSSSTASASSRVVHRQVFTISSKQESSSSSSHKVNSQDNEQVKNSFPDFSCTLNGTGGEPNSSNNQEIICHLSPSAGDSQITSGPSSSVEADTSQLDQLISQSETIEPESPATCCEPDQGEKVSCNDVNEAAAAKVEEEEDEDVREAKLNIKVYLDSVRETENFLKAMQQQEESLERQRQEMFLFNNLVLNTRLSSLKNRKTSMNLMDDDSPLSASGQQANGSHGAQSAPIGGLNTGRYLPSQGDGVCNGSMIQGNAFIPSMTSLGDGLGESRDTSTSGLSKAAANPYSPFLSTQNGNDNSNQLLQKKGAFARSSWMEAPAMSARSSVAYDPSPETSIQSSLYRALYTDPLEPVKPLDLGGPIGSPAGATASFRRSRSQLGDQFYGDTYRPGRLSTRPLSAHIADHSFSNPYFPSAASRSRRSVSQLRSASTSYSSPLSLRPAAGLSPTRSYASESGQWLGGGSELDGKYDDHEDDDDDGMSGYRVSSYVPRVVPQGQPTSRLGRASSLRPRSGRYSLGSKSNLIGYLSATISTSAKDKRLDDSFSGVSKRERRTSLQGLESANTSSGSRSAVDTDEPETSQRRYRHGSYKELRPESSSAAGGTGGDQSPPALKVGSESRLSQLEQRLQENKRRREQLLAGKVSPEPASSESSSATFKRPQRQVSPCGSDSPGATPAGSISSSRSSAATSASKFTRSSRLESMEARIKRKSYCVRMGECSPERTQLRGGRLSLEKWRQQQQYSRDGAGPSGSPRGSLTSLSSGCNLLLQSLGSPARGDGEASSKPRRGLSPVSNGNDDENSREYDQAKLVHSDGL